MSTKIEDMTAQEQVLQMQAELPELKVENEALRARVQELEKERDRIQDEMQAEWVSAPPLDQKEYESLPQVLRRRHGALREDYNAKFLKPILVAAAELERTRAAFDKASRGEGT